MDIVANGRTLAATKIDYDTIVEDEQEAFIKIAYSVGWI